MDQAKIEEHGNALYEALRARHTLSPLTTRWPEITIADAYHVSLHMVKRRMSDDGSSPCSG